MYVAEQLATERRVALKILISQLDGISVERLLTEARIPSRVNSENIVQVLDAGVDSSSSAVYLVMELLEGITLAELVRMRGPRGPAETSEYMRQIAAGLDRAHCWLDRDGRPTPIVHRDLKPENIFLTQRDDGTPLVKLLDFGTAKVLSQTTQVSGVLQGTPQYMAYEQASGDPVTAATDIWAFGLIAFHLLTGRSFWLAVAREGTYTQLFGEVLTLPLPKASERARQLGVTAAFTREFDGWFARCVNRDVTRRFPSAGVAAVELARALGVATTRPPARNLRRRAALVGAVCVAGVAGVAAKLALAPPHRPTPSDENFAQHVAPQRTPDPIVRSPAPRAGDQERLPTTDPTGPAVTLVEAPPTTNAPALGAASDNAARSPGDARGEPRARLVPKPARVQSPPASPTLAPRARPPSVYEDR